MVTSVLQPLLKFLSVVVQSQMIVAFIIPASTLIHILTIFYNDNTSFREMNKQENKCNILD